MAMLLQAHSDQADTATRPTVLDRLRAVEVEVPDSKGSILIRPRLEDMLAFLVIIHGVVDLVEEATVGEAVDDHLVRILLMVLEAVVVGGCMEEDQEVYTLVNEAGMQAMVCLIS